MGLFQAIVCLAVLAVACARPSNQYQPEPAYGDAPASYAYNYGVQDDYHGVNFGADETRDGYNTNGAYYVLLPDGRLQRVAYTVQGDSGFIADVTYEGEARPYEAQPYQRR